MLHELPGPVQDTCKAGLAARERCQCGGTGPAVKFATWTAAAGIVTDEQAAEALTALRMIERAEEAGGLGDQALEVARQLWGGDPMLAWSTGLLAPVLAAPPNPGPAGINLVGEVEVDVFAALNAVADDELRLRDVILERMEAAVDAALAKLHAKAVAALKRPGHSGGALMASIGTLDDRDVILAAMAAHDDPARSLAVIPGPVLAKLGPTIADMEMIDGVLQPAVSRISQLLAEHVDRVREAIGAPDEHDDAALHANLATDVVAAARWTLAQLQRIVTAAVSASSPFMDDPAGEPLTGRVPPSVAEGVLTRAGGGNPDTDTQDVGVGLLAAGVAHGPTTLAAVDAVLSGPGSPLTAAPRGRVPNPRGGRPAGTQTPFVGLARAGALTGRQVLTKTTWNWSGKSFPKHAALDNVYWYTEAQRQDRCANPGGFPNVSPLHPGDHRGCACRWSTRVIAVPKGAVGDLTAL